MWIDQLNNKIVISISRNRFGGGAVNIVPPMPRDLLA
jgi:hypothetical protein